MRVCIKLLTTLRTVTAERSAIRLAFRKSLTCINMIVTSKATPWVRPLTKRL
jgi:hypothetical protein